MHTGASESRFLLNETLVHLLQSHKNIHYEWKCKNQGIYTFHYSKFTIVMNQLINPSPVIHEKKTTTRVRHS